MKKKILISTGGSGGHVIPASILYDHLKKDNEVVICTDIRGNKYLNNNLSNFKIINTPKLNNIFLLPLNILIILKLIFKSYFLLRKEKISKLISTGGYMSLPLILAGKILRLKIYLLEPNLVLGRTNRFFLNSCDKIFCYSKELKNFPEKFKDKIVKIYPLVRKEFYKQDFKNVNKDYLNLLIVGGSQGASIFDDNLKSKIVNISKIFSLRIIHQTNKKNILNLKKFYTDNNIPNEIFNFDENFINIIKQSDICITRAGASTLAELSVLNIPFIAVPLPSSKDDHQFENANFYNNNDCCWVINQDNFEEKIEEILKEILQNKTNYLKKKDNLKKINYQNSWINVNQKILSVINEN